MSLPSPSATWTLSQLAAGPETAREMLQQGGAILVLTDDEQHYLGVLTRDPVICGEAELAEAIAAGRVPPLEVLLSSG